jgi:serine/threonine protein kinase/regulator of sirC expression with transglutaminase-like and TPR domain
MPQKMPSSLGPYEILAPLGAGGMGKVYLARDTRLGRKVALKVLPDEVAQDKHRQARFEQEAKSASPLNHPNIACLYDIGSDDGNMYIISELVDGESLREVIARGPVAPDRLTTIAIQLAGAIGAAHSAGIVHRDLKPENIMLTRDGRPMILDFGLAKQTKPAAGQAESAETQLMTEPGVVMGTAAYMSPEQVRAKPADPRSDIFSLGAVLYEMASGKRAFSGASQFELMNAILKNEPPPLPAQISRRLDSVIRKCLEKELDRRFQRASDLAFALEQAGGTPDRQTRAVPVWRTPAAWAGMAVAVVVAAGGLGYWAATRRTVPPKPLVKVEGEAKSQSPPAPASPPAALPSPTVSIKSPVEIPKTAIAKRTEAAPAAPSLQSAAPVPEPSKPETPPVANTSRMAAAASDLARALTEGRYADATKDFNERTRSELTALRMEQEWKLPRARVGDVLWLSPPHLEGTSLEFVWCEFQRGICDIKVIFDKDHRVAGLWYTFHAVSSEEATPSGAQAAGAANPERARMAYENGEKLFAQQKYEDATKSYDEAIQWRASYAEAYRGRCASEVRLLRYSLALLDCTRAIRMKPDDASAYRWRGDASVGFNEWEQAIAAYDEAIRLKPDEAVFLNQRANTYLRAGQYELCVRDATEGIQLNARSPALWYNRSHCYELLQMYDLAAEDATRLISLTGSDAGAYKRRGSIYNDTKQYQKALADFSEAIRLKPDDKDAYNSRGFAKDMLGDAAGAAADRDYARKLP